MMRKKSNQLLHLQFKPRKVSSLFIIFFKIVVWNLRIVIAVPSPSTQQGDDDDESGDTSEEEDTDDSKSEYFMDCGSLGS